MTRAALLPFVLLALAGCGGRVVVDETDLNEDEPATTTAPHRCESKADCSPDENPCWVGACQFKRCLRRPSCGP